MGSARISTSIPTDSLPETSDETSASPSPSTDISVPPEPEIQPEPGTNGIASNKPLEIHAFPEEKNNSPSNSHLDNANSMENKIVAEDGVDRIKEQPSNSSNAVPYSIPPWSGPPCHDYFLEVLKDGAIVDQFSINRKGAYMFGRADLCDFVLEHPTVSRFHAVIQFKSNGDAYLFDIGSTNGTFINNKLLKAKGYLDLRVGDVIQFGQSSRLYVFQRPTDLMHPEVFSKSSRLYVFQRPTDLMHPEVFSKSSRNAKMRDLEIPHLSISEGISWGLQEDAEEEAEDENEEITWQTYKGQLTEKQEKTRKKVLKRLEKIAHMNKEIDAIRAKDIAQGGLTQRQHTQIARNEQRISQILEELENLEETLNDSIRDSTGARGGQKWNAEDVEDYTSDDDEFYDRTKKPLKRGQGQSIETADTLLDKKESLVIEMEDIKKLLMREDEREQENEVPNAGDALDAYMSALSSELASKKKDKLQKELGALQSELDRVSYLLKIADPSGEAARKRALKDSDQFVDYKDETSEIENATPGLIIRKRKRVEKLENEVGPSEQSQEAELQAEDAVALLLKHSRGYGASDEDLSHDIESDWS